ncbi:uncharacterized protein DNG_02643 [Cephalotrichum gorgonifer]|uniref:Uncharacterized protein n=1 Tax=Cephalotrichum gorgonifer TaxID=2041049 RepID=A0AAE8MTK8_9PEZI|nr:uncharacterized protein DNG_02643 [Cephalotrichum gorgonifer]
MSGKATKAAPAASKASAPKKFELPSLDFNFSSLTEGTDIPAPLPSPVQEVPTPPKTPVGGAPKEASKASSETEKGLKAASEGQKDKLSGTIITGGTKRPADDTPLSPALSSRQGSIRRLFSRTLLNNSYAEGEAQANGTGIANGGRPVSRSTTIAMDEKKAKRSSGWFRRLRPGTSDSASSKRASTLYQEVPTTTKPTGPPPPMIPEFTTLSPKLDLGDDGILGGSDLFKNIK